MITIEVGSLFSGIGGIELGFERAGFTTRWFVESDLHAQTILRKRFPGAEIYGDVTQVDWRTVPKVDILTGGFPCQDISNAGRRAGITGSRSSLWSYFAEAIRVLRPRYVLCENVAALTQRGLSTVLTDLFSLGYDAEWHCVPASAIGAPHRRDRIFILAYTSICGCQTNSNFQGQQQLTRANTDVSNPACNGCIKESLREFDKRGVEKAVADPDSQRLEERKQGTGVQKPFERQAWWSTEPRVGRVADGVPNRVDRIKCLGNAVVPQVAEIFAKAIKEVKNA